jgi:hypothetical protein
MRQDVTCGVAKYLYRRFGKAWVQKIYAVAAVASEVVVAGATACGT